MGTVDKKIADNIVKHNGWYNGDSDNSMGDNPRVIEITEYDNQFGSVSYGMTTEGRKNVYTPTEFVRNPRCYWKLKD